MNVIRKIKYYCKTDEDLKRFAESRVRKLTRLSRHDNKGKLIGADLDINPHGIIYKDKDEQAAFSERPIWFGFIPKGTKIVYGRMRNQESGIPSNAGYFYHNDDVSYIYEFFKYIKDLEFGECNDAMTIVNDFIRIKLDKELNRKNRVIMHKLLIDKNNRFIEPIKEHLYSDFYYNGSARCSELALMAQNLFSSLDLDIIYLIDKEHAYNVFLDYEDPSDKEVADFYVVDYSKCVSIFDHKIEFVEYFPFVGKIEGGEQQFINIVKRGERVDFKDYFLYLINGNYYKVPIKEKRSYGIEAKIVDFDRADKKENADEEKGKALILGRKIN